MNAQRAVIGTVCAALLAIQPEILPAQKIFEDFAEDAEVFDCDPVCWEMSACCPGEYGEAPEGDGLLVKSTGGAGDRTSVILAQEVFDGNFTSRLRGRLLPEFVDVNGNDLGIVISWEPTAYYCGVTSDGRPSISRFDDLRPRGQVEGDQVDFDPTETDFELEVRVTDIGIELRVWPDGGERPVEPQVVRDERRDTPAQVGIGAEVALVYSLGVTSQPEFLRGDCNGDGKVDIADATCALNWLFAGGPEPGCLAAVNTNGDAKVDIADPVSLLGFLFGGGPRISDPFPDCGPGELPADAALGCETPPACQ